MNKLMSAEIFGLKSIPEKEYFCSVDDVDNHAPNGQAHHMRRAFQSMGLDGIFLYRRKTMCLFKKFSIVLKTITSKRITQKVLEPVYCCNSYSSRSTDVICFFGNG